MHILSSDSVHKNVTELHVPILRINLSCVYLTKRRYKSSFIFVEICEAFASNDSTQPAIGRVYCITPQSRTALHVTYVVKATDTANTAT